MLDTADETTDEAISHHVLRMHRYRKAGERHGEPLPLQNTNLLLGTVDDKEKNEKNEEPQQAKNIETPVFESNDKFLPGDKNNKGLQLTTPFLQKYFHTAKLIKPKLTTDAADLIAVKYCELRLHEQTVASGFGTQGSQMKRTQPITARTLETLIRIATAHAKARMSKVVSRKDAEMAADLVCYAIFKEVLEKTKKRRRDGDQSASEEEEEEGELFTERKERGTEKEKDVSGESLSKRVKGQVDMDAEQSQEQDVDEDMEDLEENRYILIRNLMSQVQQENVEEESMPVDKVMQEIQERNGQVTQKEIRLCLQRLHDENRGIMLTSTDVYFL